MLPRIILVLPVLHARFSLAQQYPLRVTYDAVIKSPVDPRITISYKHPDAGTCATASDKQKQYTGYVNLPPSSLAPVQQDYSINTFFWFIEAHDNPEDAPLTIWLNGGPGQSSMVGLFTEVGPCEVIPGSNSSYTTQPRPWGWDRSSNILFIDQPTQTGFSYDTRVNASIDFGGDDPIGLDSRKVPSPLPADTPAWRFKNGTFASGLVTNTEDLTAIAAESIWHFLQGFLSTFPQYNPGKRPGGDVESAAIHLFAESYGGLYGPMFADFFEEQNERRKAGNILSDALDIHLGSVGVVDGILDIVVTITSLLDFAYNNTYGIESIDFATHQSAIAAINEENGCKNLVAQCRVLAATNDPDDLGSDENTNKICAAALYTCQLAANPVTNVFRSNYDWRVEPQVWPSAAYVEYLNDANVLQSIGAPVNFSSDNSMVLTAMYSNGDAARGTQLASLARLLDRGIKVALIYGDADLIGNWYGGQNGSLELASLVPGYDIAFPAAGYAEIAVNESYVGGAVRQYGNLSFSRIYDAGHQVPIYQPETAFTVFSRVINGEDISTGRKVDLSSFSTKGPKTSDHRNIVPPQPESSCWIRQAYTCTEEQRTAIRQGKGTVQAGIWTPIDNSTKPGGLSVPSVKETSGSSSLQQNFVLHLLRRAKSRSTDDGDELRNGLIGGLCAAVALLLLVIILLCRQGRKLPNRAHQTYPYSSSISNSNSDVSISISNKYIPHPQPVNGDDNDREKGHIISFKHLFPGSGTTSDQITTRRLDPIPEASPRPSDDARYAVVRTGRRARRAKVPVRQSPGKGGVGKGKGAGDVGKRKSTAQAGMGNVNENENEGMADERLTAPLQDSVRNTSVVQNDERRMPIFE